MKFKQFAGTAIIPTISRLVLACAFITVGWNKIMTTSEYSFAEKTVLESHSVSVTTHSATAWGDGHRQVVLASFRQEEPAVPAVPAEDAPEQDPPPEPEQPEQPEQPEDADDAPQGTPGEAEEDTPTGEATPPDDAGAEEEPAVGIPGPITPVGPPGEVYTAKSLYRITLLCSEAGWPLPKWCAWLAAITEFFGGCLLLIGFLSRVWSLGLCIAMGSAFYLVSINIYEVHATNPFVFAQDVVKFNTVFNQLGLLVLSLGVLLTGPGPLSLDRFIFRPKKESGEILFDDDDADLGPSSGAARMEV